MKTKHLFLLILIVAASINGKAQTISCNSFCVTHIQKDSIIPGTFNTNSMGITIFITGGDSSAFISYPYISAITNNNGDTIATGSINSFGQFANTSQTYGVIANVDSIPANSTVYFNYNNTVCALSYPCIATGINEERFYKEATIYPNPLGISQDLFINVSEAMESCNLQIINTAGQIVLQKKLNNVAADSKITITDINLPQDIYYLILEAKENRSLQKLIIAN